MATASQIFADIESRVETHADIDADLLSSSLIAFADHAELPASDELRDAVIDSELASYLAVGGSSTSAWVTALEAARASLTATTQNAVRRLHEGFDPAGAFGALRAHRQASHGRPQLTPR